MTFDEWFHEIENFALRSERFYDEMDMLFGKELTRENMIKIVSWLKAAYDVGYEQGSITFGGAGQPWLRTYDGKLT